MGLKMNRSKLYLAIGFVIILSAAVVIGNRVVRVANASTLTQKDVPLELTSAYRDGETVKAEFCYLLPTSEDWQLLRPLGNVTLYARGISIAARESYLSVFERPGNTRGLKRCSTVVFQVPSKQELGEVTIQVNRMMTSEPDVLDCNTAQKKIDESEKFKGLVIQCIQGDHAGGFEVIHKPDNINTDEANAFVNFEVFTNSIKGPWSFTTTIK